METATHFHKRQQRSLKQACLEEALRSLSRGQRDFSLRDIARRLGVSHGAPYKHFASKEHLLAELATQAYAELAVDLQSEVDSAHSALEKILKYGYSLQKFAENNPQKWALMLDADISDMDLHENLKIASAHCLQMIEEVTESMSASGQMPMSIGTRDLSQFIWCWNVGLAQNLMLSRQRTLGAAMALTEKRYRDLAAPLICCLCP